LPRLLVLAGIMIAGWVLVWQYSGRRPQPVEPPIVVGDSPSPVVPDRSIEFESVTDRTPMSLRDNAAFARLLERARSKTPSELAKETRRDILLTHIWERPELYRGVPIHLDGTARRSLRYESKLSKTGWLYEAWIELPDVRGIVYDCVFEEPPRGFPLGSDISERVVFNGYFLKIVVYQAAAVNEGESRLIRRGSPVLVGRIGWNPAYSAGAAAGSGSTLRWTLILLGVMVVISAVRWLVQLGRFFGRRDRPRATPTAPNDQIDPFTLERWVEAVAAGDGEAPAGPIVAVGFEESGSTESRDSTGRATTEGPAGTADSGARPSDEAQSTSSPVTGG
jgi:hypothetical protein